MFNKKFSNKICTVAIICCLSIIPAFAEEEYTEDFLIKSIKKESMKNLSPTYIDEIKNFAYKLLSEEKNAKEALKAADYLVAISKKFYGENSVEVGYAYVDKGNLNVLAARPSVAVESFKNAKEIAEKSPNDSSVKNLINEYTKSYYSMFEQPTKYIELIETTQKENTEKKLEKITALSSSGDAQSSLKLLKVLEKKAINTKNEELLVNVYEYYINIYKDLNNYEEMNKYIQKAEKYVDKYPYIKNTIIHAQINYYREFSQFDKAREIFDKNFAPTTNNDKSIYYNTLYDIEKDRINLDTAKECVNNLNELYKESYPTESIEFSSIIYDKFIDINKDLRKTKKAQKYINKSEKVLEPVKELVPIKYAKLLANQGNFEMYSQNYQEALEYFKNAISIYEELEPSSIQLSFTYNYAADAELYSGNFDNAFVYANKAIAHNKKYRGNLNKDLADFYLMTSCLHKCKGEKSAAEKDMNKAISIYSKIYGENNVKTLNKKVEQYQLYKEIEQLEKAEKILNNINSIVENNKIEGSSKEFLFDLAMANAYAAIDKNNYEQALLYIKEAETAGNDIPSFQKEIYKIKQKINEEQGKKIKALKYKTLEKRIK